MKKQKNKLIIFLSFMLLFFSCQKENEKTALYLHASHLLYNDASIQQMDTTFLKFDLSPYSIKMFGGDLTYNSTGQITTLNYIDSLLYLSDTTTLFSVGNHDYSSLSNLQSFTNRLSYYTYHKNDITFIVLDTQIDHNDIVDAQLQLVQTVCDTINESSHLIVLHHKLLWLMDSDSLQQQVPTISNGNIGDCFHCLDSCNFYTEIYPLFLAVKNRNIEVILLAGDIGNKIKSFEQTNADGIVLLASGIKASTMGNKVLVFEHQIADRKLSWEFIDF
ncbi:MAG: hypothetical protein ACPG5B_14990 [Chitinophagales bacterium]